MLSFTTCNPSEVTAFRQNCGFGSQCFTIILLTDHAIHNFDGAIKHYSPSLIDMNKPKIKERTLIIIKPDAFQRGLLGEIIHRFEDKGLKLAGIKMVQLSDILLDKHYAQHKGKHFFEKLKKFMKLLPVVLMVWEGLESVRVARAMCGSTDGKNAPPGTIRGDFSMSTSANIVHSSEDIKAANREIGIFFRNSELINYNKPDVDFYYAEDER